MIIAYEKLLKILFSVVLVVLAISFSVTAIQVTFVEKNGSVDQYGLVTIDEKVACVSPVLNEMITWVKQEENVQYCKDGRCTLNFHGLFCADLEYTQLHAQGIQETFLNTIVPWMSAMTRTDCDIEKIVCERLKQNMFAYNLLILIFDLAGSEYDAISQQIMQYYTGPSAHELNHIIYLCKCLGLEQKLPTFWKELVEQSLEFYKKGCELDVRLALKLAPLKEF